MLLFDPLHIEGAVMFGYPAEGEQDEKMKRRKWLLGLKNSLVPKMMKWIKVVDYWAYKLRNIENGNIEIFNKNLGSQWYNKVNQARGW